MTDYKNAQKQEYIKAEILGFEIAITKLAMTLGRYHKDNSVSFNPDVEKYIGLAVSQATTLQATMMQASKSIKEIEK